MKQAIVQIAPMFLARANAAAYLSISESMLDTLVARGEAPKPRKLSPGRSAWLVDDLKTWGKARPVSDLLPPENSGYGKAGKPD
jgi:prophage regulatory protein